MSQIRRTHERRRRVLYQAHVSPQSASARVNRGDGAESREGRQPAQEFGSRVHRHLRGRWFSLVPVSRAAIVTLGVTLIAMPITLLVLHHLAYTWPTLAYRESIARPLYINRPDSFGAFWLTMVLLVSAGATRLIYVLRRHRRDDYRGHYQLWRLTLTVLLIACVHSTVGLVEWVGGWLDLLVGDRAVLSGAKWLRIGLDVGGIILAMRLIVEVYHCRPALIAMVSAALFLGAHEAATWNMITVDSVLEASIMTAAPMLGCSCFLVSALIYLRLLYRQVRNIPVAPTMRERFSQWMEDRKNQDEEIESDFFEHQEFAKPAAARRERRRTAVAEKPATTRSSAPQTARSQNTPTQRTSTQNAASRTQADRQEDAEEQPQTPKKPGLLSRMRRRPKPESEPDQDASEQVAASESDDESIETKPKRRWFGLRGAKDSAESDSEPDTSNSTNDDSEQEPRQKKPWFSLRLKPQSASEDESGEDNSREDKPSKSSSEDSDEDAKRPGLFGRLFGGKKASDDEDDESDGESSADAKSRTSSQKAGRGGTAKSAGGGPLSAASRRKNTQAPAAANPQSETEDDELLDPDDIDWNSMSKSERRRMRKRLKRSGRAA